MVWFAIAVGGALGSMARHGVSVLMHERIALRFYWREFLFVGILGGFTTFSTFGLDTITLARAHSTNAALLNVAGQVLLGLLAVKLGMLVGARG